MMAFKAGRAFRRPGTNFVDPSPVKGAIVLFRDESFLVHFTWKDRTTGDVGEDLILFPGDAKFEKVSQSSWGRTYVLKFESSDQKHFVCVKLFHGLVRANIGSFTLVLDAGEFVFSTALECKRLDLMVGRVGFFSTP